MQAIIESYPDLLKDIYPKSASALMGRFKEREENVKSDIFQTFVELVKQVGATAERFEGGAGPTPIDQLRSDALYLGLHLVCVATMCYACSVLLDHKGTRHTYGRSRGHYCPG